MVVAVPKTVALSVANQLAEQLAADAAATTGRMIMLGVVLLLGFVAGHGHLAEISHPAYCEYEFADERTGGLGR